MRDKLKEVSTQEATHTNTFESFLVPHISQVKTWFQNQRNRGKRENLDDNLEAEKPEKEK